MAMRLSGQMADKATNWNAVVIVDKEGNPVDDITKVSNIGNLADYVRVPYNHGINSILAHLNTVYYHIHGTSFVYPSHADDILLTSGVGAWDLTGALTEVIPAGALNVSTFDLHWINISGITDNSTIQIDIFAGDIGEEVLIGATRASRTTNQDRNGPSRIQIPQQAKSTRISCRLSDSTADNTTVEISFEGHYYH